ncbi:MAG: PIN domain-containing protein [Nitrososphaerales archaeon]
MSIIDTSLLVDRISEGKAIDEDVCIISAIEYPRLLEYARFHGKILYPEIADFELALELQNKLKQIGRMKGASDLIIAATCINARQTLLTLDSDFEDISRVSGLKVVYK